LKDDNCIFKAVCKTEVAKDYYELLHGILEDKRFLVEVKEDGIYAEGMDPSHIRCIFLKLPKNMFSTYEYTQETSYVVTEPVLALLKKHDAPRVLDQYTLTINPSEVEENETEAMHTISDSSAKLSETTYNNKYDVSEEVPRPKINFDATLVLVTDALLQCMPRYEPNEATRFIYRPGNKEAPLRLEGYTGNVDETDSFAEIPPDSDLFVDHGLVGARKEAKSDLPIASIYSHASLVSIIKSLPQQCCVIDFSYRSEMPVRITPHLPEAEVTIWLAPMIKPEPKK